MEIKSPTNQLLKFWVQLSEDLSMDTHIWAGTQNMVKAINSKIALLRILKPFIPTKELGNIGSSLINSAISYGAPVWGSTSKCNINRLQKCQTNAARVILKKTWQIWLNKTHRQDLMQTLGWRNVNQLVATSMLSLTKSALDGASSN